MSVDSPEQSQKLRARLGMELPLYTDTEGNAAKAWQVFDAESEFALAASFVVAPGGAVIYRYIGTSKADRPAAAELLAAVPQPTNE